MCWTRRCGVCAFGFGVGHVGKTKRSKRAQIPETPFQVYVGSLIDAFYNVVSSQIYHTFKAHHLAQTGRAHHHTLKLGRDGARR